MSALIGSVWCALLQSVTDEFWHLNLPAWTALVFIAVSMSIAWILRPILARAYWLRVLGLGAATPIIGAFAVGFTLGTVWLFAGVLHGATADFTLARLVIAPFEMGAVALFVAFASIHLVVPLGIASLFLLRAVLVFGRSAEHVEPSAR